MIARSDVQLLMLPGLGGDHRMHYHQAKLGFTLITPDYIPPLSSETLAEYSQRFYTYIAAECGLDTERPFVIAGHSLGGAVAQEIAMRQNVDSVILIGSLRSKSELAKFYLEFGRRISPHIPIPIYLLGTFLVPVVLSAVSMIPLRDAMLAVRMYAATPKKTFRDLWYKVSVWEGCDCPVPIFRIHGRADHIIPIKKARSVDVIVDHAKHLVALSQPENVNAAILSWLSERFEVR